MIGKDLARQIHNCHSQIEECDNLVEKMSEAIEKNGDEKLLDAFGHRQGFEFGIPIGSSSSGGHRVLKNVSPDMAIKVINEHKEFNQRELKRLNGLALIQCQGV
jgi:hypothetical protein